MTLTFTLAAEQLTDLFCFSLFYVLLCTYSPFSFWQFPAADYTQTEINNANQKFKVTHQRMKNNEMLAKRIKTLAERGKMLDK